MRTLLLQSAGRLLIPVVLAGCQESAAPTSPSSAAPQFNFSNGPAQPGPRVFRGPFLVIWTFEDSVKGLTATVGLSSITLTPAKP
jgi:hypothetical protein